MSDLQTLETIRELRAEIALAEGKRKAKERGKEAGPRESHRNSTWIYIATFTGDTGQRPLAGGTNSWNSPAIALYDGDAEIVANQMRTGKEYQVRVEVSNGGDTYADSCHVDLYICDPSLGFTRETGTLLGTTVITVPPMSKTEVRFPFKASAASIGHRCLFGLAYNLPTNDFPQNAGVFNPNLQRHTGQQNISIITGSEIIPVNLINFTGGKNLQIEVRQRTKQFTRLQTIPQLHTLTIQTRQLQVLPELIQFDSVSQRTKLVKKPGLIEHEHKRITPRGKLSGVSALSKNTAKQPRLLHRGGTSRIGKWKVGVATDKPLLMGLRFPKMKLGKQEVAVFDVELRSPDTKEIVGGITLVYRN